MLINGFFKISGFFHFLDDLFLSLPCKFGTGCRIIVCRSIRHSGKKGTFVKIHLRRNFTKIAV